MTDRLTDCPCTTIEQDEDCAVGYPSLLCGACKGTGRAPEATVTALAAEMLRIASDIGEPEDPFAAWESIDLIKSQRDQLRKALEPFSAFRTPDHPGRYSDPVGDHFRPEAFEAARAAMSAKDADHG